MIRRRLNITAGFSRVFLLITAIATLFLLYNFYRDYRFDNSHLSKDLVVKIETKASEIENLIYTNFKIRVDIPIIISNDIHSNLFGLAIYDQKGMRIVLNKKRFKESSDYMINSVLPHEYAHIMMFILGDFSRANGGHTQKWQKICTTLTQKECSRFVNHNDIILGKVGIRD
jgi:hypothetical protein